MSSQALSLLYRVARSVRPDATQLPDAELVHRFAQNRDPAAFELLLWRHGPMVWGVCPGCSPIPTTPRTPSRLPSWRWPAARGRSAKDGKYLASSSPEAPVFVWDVYGLP